MTALLDTGFLYALFDNDDQHHADVEAVVAQLSFEPLLPTVVLVELAYLLQARLGHDAMRNVIRQLVSSSIPMICLTPEDLSRIHSLLEIYADASLDFVDAAIVSLAERLDIRCIFTVDRRDFLMIRSVHCAYFELLP